MSCCKLYSTLIDKRGKTQAAPNSQETLMTQQDQDPPKLVLTLYGHKASTNYLNLILSIPEYVFM